MATPLHTAQQGEGPRPCARAGLALHGEATPGSILFDPACPQCGLSWHRTLAAGAAAAGPGPFGKGDLGVLGTRGTGAELSPPGSRDTRGTAVPGPAQGVGKVPAGCAAARGTHGEASHVPPGGEEGREMKGEQAEGQSSSHTRHTCVAASS